MGVVVWTGENDTKTKSFLKRNKTALFSFENGLVWTEPKVLPLKLLLDIVPSFSADITLARCLDVFVKDLFTRAKENLQRCGMSSLIF